MIRQQISRGKVPTRFIIAGMICAASILAFIVQGSMSVAIVAMTKSIYDDPSAIQPDYGPRYEWSAYDQSLVLGSYFWGYTVAGIFAGILAERFGARNVAGFCIVLNILSSALTPVAAIHIWLLILARFVSGSAVGMIFPSLQELIAKWAPPEEKGKFLSALLSTGIGTVIDWSLSGVIIQNLGWNFAFYMVAVALGLFAISWYFVVFDSPNKHPRISINEKEFILSKLSSTNTQQKSWPPVRAILSSTPFWALMVCHFGCLWGLFFFTTATPKYLTEVHNLNITITGLLSSIPYLVRFISGIFFGLLGDVLLTKEIFTPNAIRKCFVLCCMLISTFTAWKIHSTFSTDSLLSIIISFKAHIIPGLFLIGLTFVGSQPYLCVAFITLALGFNGAMVITSLQNPHDIAPNFSSTIYGWMLAISSTSGFLAPLVVAHFTKERSTQDEWFYIFLIGAAIYIGSAIIFILFGSGNTQKWNDLRADAETDNSKTKLQD